MTQEFDYLARRRKLESYKNNLFHMERTLSTAAVTNGHLETLEAKKDKAKQTIEGLNLLIHVFTTLNKRARTEDDSFKEKRVAFVSSYIDDAISTAFPAEKFVSKIKFDPRRKGGKAYLVLIDPDGYERIPAISEGKMMQQTLSFSGSVGISRSLGKDKGFFDEAFAAGSPETHQKTSRLILEELERGAQIFMIEQKSEGYKDIPRREFHLLKDEATEITSLVNVYDF